MSSITGDFFFDDRTDGKLSPMPGYNATVVIEEAQKLARQRANADDYIPVVFVFGGVSVTVRATSNPKQIYYTWLRSYNKEHPNNPLPMA